MALPLVNGFPAPAGHRLAGALIGRPYTAMAAGALLCWVAIYQVPEAINPTLLKIGLALGEVVALLVLARLARFGREQDWMLLAVAGLLLGSKTLYGVVVAHGLLNVPITSSLMEARFGFALISLPIIFQVFKRANRAEIATLIAAFTVTLVIIDVAALIIIPDVSVLAIGQRGAQRFVLSTMGVSAIAYFYFLKCRTMALPCHWFIFSNAAVWLLHVFLITTSRSDAAVVVGLLGALTINGTRLPQHYVFIALACVLPFVVVFAINQLSGGTVAGRDIRYFVSEMTASLPTGVGFLPDATRNSSVVHLTPIFASDYGVGLYIYRYGILALGLIGTLAYILRRGFRTSLLVNGAPLFVAMVTVYVLVVPFWEYGAMNGAILTATLLAVVSHRPRGAPNPGYAASNGAAPRQAGRPQIPAAKSLA